MKPNKSLRSRSLISERQKPLNSSLNIKRKQSCNSQAKLFYKCKNQLINSRYDKFKTQYQENNEYPVLNQFYQQKLVKDPRKASNTLKDETLHQQNITLKRKINQLNEDLNIQKCKTLMQLKQKTKIVKQMSFQIDYNHNIPSVKDKFKFDKNPSKHNINNSYMISGIKHRYDLLKQQYQNKCKQLSNIAKKTQSSSILELQSYVSALEEQNKKLLETIQAFRIKKQSFYNQNNYFQAIKKINQNNKSKNQSNQIKNSFIQQLDKQIDELTLINCELQLQNKILNQRIVTFQRQKEVIFVKQADKNRQFQNLKKVITLKDNQIYQINKILRRLTKEKKNSDEKKKLIQQQIQTIKFESKQQIEIINLKSKKMYQIQKNIFNTQINKKQAKISKLEKQISYLSTLLKYWKPLDEIENQAEKLLSPQKSQICPSQQQKLNRSSSMLGSIRKRTKTRISVGQKNVIDFKLGFHEQNYPDGVSEKMSQNSMSQCQSSQVIQIREAKTSRKKHSQEAMKVRKILPNQIQYLKKELYYRAIGYQIEINSLKTLFQLQKQTFISGKIQLQLNNYQKQITKNVVQKQTTKKILRSQILFAKQFITMNQIKCILKKRPFQLQQKEAFMLSRYIVQDASAEHVYCDQSNQIDRNIVKSIISAFIGEYNLVNKKSAKEQWLNILKNYETNLKLALTSLAPNRVICYQKLLELFESIQIQATQNLKDFIISKLFVLPQQINGKPKLNQLKYDYLFDKRFSQC